ncbi:MAG: hypothetical protein SF029_09130 [bacterium]|nr:hypothetical protein [bacterium]
MSTVHLDWQPVILLKIVRLPFKDYGGLSVQRAYLALDAGRLLYADWTLEADERSATLICPTGWTRLDSACAAHIPYALGRQWGAPYSDGLFALYLRANASFTRFIRRIDMYPTDPVTLATLTRLTQLL